MDNMTDFRILESMTDSQILALIRNDLIKVQKGLENFQNDMKKVQNEMEKLQESLAKTSACTKKLGSLVEDGLYDGGACVGDSTCDDSQQQIFIVAEDDDLVDEADDTINLGDELSFSVDNQVVVPYLDETMNDIDDAANDHVRETPKSSLYSALKIETHRMSEEFQEIRSYSYFWIFDPGIFSNKDDVSCQMNWLQYECYHAGVQFFMGNCRAFQDYCKDNNITLNDKCFTLSYDTYIPHQEELGIIVGLHARVAQVYGISQGRQLNEANQLLNDASLVAEVHQIQTELMGKIFSFNKVPSSNVMKWHPGVDCDPFWLPILTSSIEAQLRFLFMKMAFTTSPDMIFDLADNPNFKCLLVYGYFVTRRTIMRDYDGFNGPGFFRGAFDSILALVRDYDGFNGPGHTLRTRCL